MEALYHQSNSMLQNIEQDFQKLGPFSDSEVENNIELKLTEVNSNCNRLDVLLYKLPASQRQSAKIRVNQLKYDIRHLESALNTYRNKKRKHQGELTEREQLLNHRFAPNTETRLDIDYSLRQHNQLDNAKRGVDEMLATGGNILGSLINQRHTLSVSRKRLTTIGSTLGLSNQTMKMIEKRFVEDKYIMLAGMSLTLFIIFAIMYYFIL